MRNATITKTLLCGVMATTFFLINCQKAPNRGVKAQAGPGSVSTADTKAQVVVECSPSFLTAYSSAVEEIKKLETLASTIKSDSSESEKEAIKSQEKIARAKLEDAVSEITKIKADATACKSINKDTKKESLYPISNIKGSLDKINLELAGKDVKTEGLTEAQNRQEAAKEAAKKKQEERALKGLSENMEFFIADKLAEALKSSNKGGVIYIKAGNVVTRPSTDTLEKDRKDTSISICELGEGTGDVEKEENGQTKAKVMSIQKESNKDAQLKRYKLSVLMTAKSSNVAFECLIADSDRAVPEKAFRNVMAELLLTKENIEAKKKKDEAKKVTVDSAKAELAKREEAVRASVTGITNKEGQLAIQEVALSDATTAKDEAKIKTLTEEITALKASIVELKKEHEKLEKLAAEAKAALEKVEKEKAA